jgi:hypothetical protein
MWGYAPVTYTQENPMARIARTKNHQPVEAAAEPIADRTPGTARDMAEKGTGTTLRLIGTMAAPAKDMVRSPPDTALQGVVPPTHAAAAAFGMVKAGGALAGFWLEQTNEQLAHTAQTLKKLAAARGWRERLEIQSAFVGGSLARLGEGVSRHADLTGTMVTRLRGTGAGAPAATSNSERHR